MADEIFTATTTWQAVELGSVDVQNQVVSVYGHNTKRIGFIKSASQPTASNGVAFIDSAEDGLKYSLTGDNKLWCKTEVGTSKFGVIGA